MQWHQFNMKQLINKFSKEQGYTKGQIYKVCPDVLLNKFLEYKQKKIKFY